MAHEDTILDEAMDNLKEAGQRIRATQSSMHSEGMTEGENYRDLLTRLSTALAMADAAYLEAPPEGSLTSRRVSTPQGYRRDADEPLAPGCRR